MFMLVAALLSFALLVSCGKKNAEETAGNENTVGEQVQMVQWRDVYLEQMNMVLVEGSSPDARRKKVESFYICDHEVTQVEWMSIMNDNPSSFRGDDLPVEGVSWFDAAMYCNELSKLNGLTECYAFNGKSVSFNSAADGYRLPTESEWEFASRGGNTSGEYQYCGGDNAEEVAWFAENSAGMTHAVRSKDMNELELYDMSGNVYEWTSGADGTLRVFKGGCWDSEAQGCKPGCRYAAKPSSSSNRLGFRIACNV